MTWRVRVWQYKGGEWGEGMTVRWVCGLAVHGKGNDENPAPTSLPGALPIH